MAFTKAKIVMAGLAVTAVCIVAPQQLKAQVPEAQMDGVMGQSIEDETVYESKPDLDTLIEKNAPVFGNRTSLKKASSYSSAFLNASFTTAGDYTSATYYHKADYADDELVNGIDVSYWQADAALKKKYSKDRTKWTQTGLDWESIHGAGIDFAFVRVASRDTKDGSIYRDNCADSHIQGAVSNDINVGLYFFSQALNETEAREEAQYVLDMIDQYGWNVSMPIIMDREAGANKRLTAGKLSKTKETAVCQAFADTITAAGYRAGVYASYAWIKNYINTDALYDCSLWVARYNNTTTSNTKSGTPYSDVAYDYEFWQYSSVAKVSGYTGNLDVNFWYKDTSAKTGGLKATVGNAFDPVKLSWGKAADDVTGYRVYRYDEKQKKYVYMKQTSGKSFTDTDVTSGKTYQYRVRCFWTIGGTNYYGNYSSVVSATVPPAKVSDVKTQKRSSTYVTLGWSKISGSSGYRVYKYNTAEKKYESVATIAGGAEVSYKVTGLSGATTYKFKVKSYKKAEGETVWGEASDAHEECTNPLKVKNLRLQTKSCAVTLKWDKTSNVTGYQIYRYNSKTKKYDKIATIKNNKTFSYKDSKLKKGTASQYKVRAYKSYNGKTYVGTCSDVTKIKVK